MSQVTETVCDYCDQKKGKSNHWWSVWPSNVGFHVYPGTYDKNNSDFPEVNEKPAKDCCSESCVMRALSSFLDEVRNNG